MKKDVLLFFVFLSTLYLGCDQSSQKPAPSKPKTAEELRMELLLREQMAPTEYLSVDAKIHENKILVQKPDLFHHSKYETDGWIITGDIKNSATLAKYKDPSLIVTYYSQTETEIDKKQFVLYEFLKPNSNTPFEIKVYPPQAMVNFNIQISDATAVR